MLAFSYKIIPGQRVEKSHVLLFLWPSPSIHVLSSGANLSFQNPL